MYLKELSLCGFKSFAEKTTLRFQPGVTAIVGPNGCGKSNVSDSVRWVLGEQSAKALRGGEMTDVIFSGTDSRKALGMAEVSLTVTDIKEKLTPIPGVSFDYNEITVTRRVFRDGQSQYFINKVPCRLKDLQQIFWDTGIGRGAYSMMEQGKIDLVVSSKPEDRRGIFEEAAGITKFKHQKKEALRKLEYVEANLVRVTDIIREVKRQIGSLQRQAGKARRYKEIHEELKKLDCALARHKFDLLIEEIKNLTTQSAALDERALQSATGIESDETALTQLRRDLDALDQKIRATEQREFEMQRQAERAQSQIQFNTQRIAESQSLTQKHTQDIAAAEGKISEQQEMLASVNAQLEAFSATLEAAESHLQQQLAALRTVDQQVRASVDAHRNEQNSVVDLQRRIASLRNELSSIENQKRDETLRFERLSAEKASLEEQLARITARREQFQQQHQAERDQLDGSKKTQQDAEQNFANAASEEAVLEATLSKKQNELSSLRSRLQTLEQLREKSKAEQETLLGELSAAVATSASEPSEISNLESQIDSSDILATLTQVITIEPDFSTAIEAALGNHLQTILVRDIECAKRIRESLNGQNKKSIALAPLDLAAIASGNGSTPLPQGALCWAHTKATATEEFSPIVRRLLSDVLVAPDLHTAIEIHRADAGAHDIATLQGEFVSRRGIISFGPQGHGAFSLPIPQSQIDELTKSVAKLTDETLALEKELAQAAETSMQSESALHDTRSKLHALEVTLATRDGEFAAIENEWRETKNKIETVRWEIQRMSEAGGEEKQRIAQIHTDLAACEQQNQQAEGKLSESSRKVEESRALREEASQRVTDAKVALAAQQQKRDTLLAQQAPVANRVRELQELIETRKREIEEATAKVQQLTAEIEQSKLAIAESEAAQATIQGEVALLRESRQQEFVGKIEAQEATIREKRKAQNEFQSKKNGLEIQLAQKRMETQNLTERVARQYQVNIEDIRSENITVTIVDAGQPQKSEVGPTELAEAGLANDWNAMEAQVAELQAKIESMGPVNLEAITEYDELEGRHKFLTEQHEDLVKSQQQLMQLISRINTETRKMFSETFEKVRVNFQNVFTELFGGGKANLILADESDPLECGIEIVAKPPGKQLQSISLLSGGERAMTAVALLFSIYMVKPSPFCLLDEIDAPLDESNINRFVKMLQRFITESQFVIISHNKRTIAMSDAIYGVTMEEHGVSKLVSVQFKKRAQAAPVAAPSGNAEPAPVAATDENRGAAADLVAATPSNGSVAIIAAHDEHDLGHAPISNDLLNDHDSRRAPVPHHTMESYEPEDETPDNAEISTGVVNGEAVPEVTPPPPVEASTKPEAEDTSEPTQDSN